MIKKTTTIKAPMIDDHIPLFFSKESIKALPNLANKNDTRKNLKPRANKEVIKKIKILKPIKPLVMVKTLKGKGVNPAKKRVPSQKYAPLP